MKILYVITGLGLGGAEKVVADLADQMVLRGHEVKIVYLKGEATVRPKSQIVELIYLGLESFKNIIIASKKYRQLIHQYQPDVVHAHMVHANIFARLNRIGCRVSKLICTAHNSNEGGRIRMLAYRYTNFLSNFNSNVSKEAAQAFIDSGNFTTKNLIPIYNGIDLGRFYYQAIKERRITTNLLAVGRFNEQKDYPNLLNALSLVVKQYSNVHLSIAGDGELRFEIEILIEQLQLSNYVTLLGRQEDIPSLMQQADVFILASKYEGFGLVVAEAMASGTFVVATDCGGVKEVMGKTGILVSPQDSIALSDAIIKAINMTEEEKQNNNHLAHRHVQQEFDLNKISDQWEHLYVSK